MRYVVKKWSHEFGETERREFSSLKEACKCAGFPLNRLVEYSVDLNPYHYRGYGYAGDFEEVTDLLVED